MKTFPIFYKISRKEDRERELHKHVQRPGVLVRKGGIPHNRQKAGQTIPRRKEGASYTYGIVFDFTSNQRNTNINNQL